MPDLMPRPESSRRPLILAVLAGLALMIGAGVSYFASHPSLTLHTEPPRPESRMPQSTVSEEIMRLMAAVQKNPTDQETLIALAEMFMQMEAWDRAENFAMRALVAAPGAARPLFQLGIIQHRQERHAEAAASFQKALEAENDPAIRYSLGLLYAHYLNKPEEGLAELQKAMYSPKASKALQEAAAKEIEHIRQHQAAQPGGAGGESQAVKTDSAAKENPAADEKPQAAENPKEAEDRSSGDAESPATEKPQATDEKPQANSAEKKVEGQD